VTSYLVDTNVISASAPSAIVLGADLVGWIESQSSNLFLSVITIAEVTEGITKAIGPVLPSCSSTRTAADQVSGYESSSRKEARGLGETWTLLDLRQSAEYIVGRLPRSDFKCRRRSR